MIVFPNLLFQASGKQLSIVWNGSGGVSFFAVYTRKLMSYFVLYSVTSSLDSKRQDPRSLFNISTLNLIVPGVRSFTLEKLVYYAA